MKAIIVFCLMSIGYPVVSSAQGASGVLVCEQLYFSLIGESGTASSAFGSKEMLHCVLRNEGKRELFIKVPRKEPFYLVELYDSKSNLVEKTSKGIANTVKAKPGELFDKPMGQYKYFAPSPGRTAVYNLFRVDDLFNTQRGETYTLEIKLRYWLFSKDDYHCVVSLPTRVRITTENWHCLVNRKSFL